VSGELFDPLTLVPGPPTLDGVRQAAAECRACHLWERGTQTVFGEGPAGADVLFVGEQPGNDEDLEGRPFVGPAGRVFDEALGEAGLDRSKTYVTNAVKHFKWEPRGKRRIHQKPNWSELTACRPWLEAELRLVDPRVVVALGATAAQDFFGRSFRVTKQRGEPIASELHPCVVATVHPSSILRTPDDRRDEARAAFVADLRTVVRLLG
jgi:DNA polymerase